MVVDDVVEDLLYALYLPYHEPAAAQGDGYENG
jgi:hypothetical protein